MSSSSVWVQLYYEDIKKGRPTSVRKPTEVKESDWNIDALVDAVKDKLSPDIDHASPSRVFVYPPDTKPPFLQANSIRPGKKLSELIEELKDTTPPTSDDHPLIVVAPDAKKRKKQAAGDPGFPFNDSIYILYSKPDGNKISVIATAFAAAKTVALTAGHTISSKDKKSGKTMVIGEPLFLTTVLVRNDDVISPEEGKLEIPVTVEMFHYDNDWAVLKRSDGGVFPQMIPVATSRTDIPRDGASEPMTFYHVPVALFRDDTEYTDRLHVTPKQGSVGLVKKNYIDFQNGGFDGSSGGPYVYMGKAIAIHTCSLNSALTAEALRIHQIQQGDRTESNKRMIVADAVTLADSCAVSHTSVGSGMLIYKRLELVECVTAQDST